MACTDHGHIFQQEQQQQSKNSDEEDGGKFANSVPTFVGGTHSENDDKFGKQSSGWESVGGLQHVINCMKEVVVLPLLYPQFFDSYGITPPRGILLHGYPGTGKTHVVRALVASCARGDKRIAYFSCKGADCLGKYVGESEKNLTQLFEAAHQSQPSIIFFDEIDGLAPSRSNNTTQQQQDQTNVSVVSTLLSLLDGIKSRGSVVVIGATNRPNSLDPALRRPGRFDREIYFPLPSLQDRISILSLYTQNWPPKPPSISQPRLLPWIATKTPGFAGADLQALCTQAAIIAFKRYLPVPLDQQQEQQPLPKQDIISILDDIVVEERDWLEALSTSPPPCSLRDQSSFSFNHAAISSPIPSHLIPCLVRPLSTLLVSLYMEQTICLPNTLCKTATAIESVMVSALKTNKIYMDTNYKWWFHVDDLMELDDDHEIIANEISNEIERKLVEAAAGPTCTGVNNVDGVEDSSFGNGNENGKQRSFILEKSPGFRIMIAGNLGWGQRYLASFILNSYCEHVQIRKLDLITLISQGYSNNFGQGIAIIVADFVSRGPCLIFMPRVDSWAVESQDARPSEEENCKIRRASYAWNIFTEQLELLSHSTPLIILATSDVPFLLLPQDIRNFFGKDLSSCKLVEQKKHIIPRFSIQVDDNFNRKLVMDRSANRVSKELAKYFAGFIHKKYHDDLREEEQRKEKEDRNKLLVSEAICRFGYEILQNPQFFVLCVVTSRFKLEELGPCASISESEWNELKFKESCVVHDHNELLEENHEDGFRVKGLVAVGLLATRGVYTTLQQVCSDVGAVLSVLVEKVNAKVDAAAGKDSRRYFHLSSQAAWLKDIVDSWAYYYQQQSLRVLQNDDCTVRRRHGGIDIPNIICGMNCCPGCVRILHVVTGRILSREFSSSKRFDWSPESIDEIVMRTLMKLAAKVRESFEGGGGKGHRRRRRRKELEEEEYKKLVESYGMESCGCKMKRNSNSNNGMGIISECGLCHSSSSSSSSKLCDDGNYYYNYKFVFKNNVLVDEDHPALVDEEHDQLFYNCKYHAFCLAYIIQIIAKKKKKKKRRRRNQTILINS